ncbi:MAG: flagellar basal body-associated FliL family protein [Chloroflexi bacterium]|nr:flagellar basal body-associated FliL family protein [Chloroflexota bacterium]
MRRLLGRKLIMGGIAVIAILGGAAAAFFYMPALSSAIGLGSVQGAGEHPVADTQYAKEKSPEPGMMYPMKERVINLADPGGFRYIKIQIVLEYDLPEARGLAGDAYKKHQDELIKSMASRSPILDDVVTTVLAGKTAASLASAEGKEKLREELKSKLGEVAKDPKLQNAYFTEFIIQ